LNTSTQGAINIGTAGSYLSSNTAYTSSFVYLATGFAWYFRADGLTTDVVSLNVAPSGTAGATLAAVQAFSASQTGLMTFPNGISVTGGNASITNALNVSGTITGLTVSAAYTGNGSVGLYNGSTSATGYISFFNPAGVRQGYIGFGGAGGVLALETENGTTGYAVSGTFSVAGTTSLTGSLSTSGNITVGSNTATNPYLYIDAAAAMPRNIVFQTAGLSRWAIFTDTTTESGSNAGCNFFIGSFTDAGAYNLNCLSINRATSCVSFPQILYANAGIAIINGISFGSLVGASNTDLSKHINLWGGTYGFNITSNTLNYVVGSGAAHNFVLNGTSIETISSTGVSVIGTLSSSGNLTVGSNTASNPFLTINGAAATQRVISFDTAGLQRWFVATSNTAEGGSNVGSDFFIERFTDAGVYIDTPFVITRSTGLIAISDGLTVYGAGITGTAISATTLSATGTVSGAGFTNLLSPYAPLAGATFTGAITITGVGVPIVLNNTAGGYRMLEFATANVVRWEMGVGNDAESGSNAGATFNITAFGDGGAYIASPLSITRSSGLTSINNGLTVSGTTTLSGATTVGGYLTTTGRFTINGGASTARDVYVTTGGSSRWVFGCDAETESGSNAGSNWYLQAFSDSAAYLSQPLLISRASGLVTMANGITSSPISGSTGSFTTLSASSTVSGAGFTALLSPYQQAYQVPGTSGSAQWVLLGTYTPITNGTGDHILLRFTLSNGYNANYTQNTEATIFFKTSNGASVDANGFAGDCHWNQYGHGLALVNVKWVGNAAGTAATNYKLYVSLSSNTGAYSTYVVTTSIQGAWANAGTLGQTDPGVGSSTVSIGVYDFTVTATAINLNGQVNSSPIDITDSSTNSSGSLIVSAVNSASGVNIALFGNGSTTPNKYLRAAGGTFQIMSSAYSVIVGLTDAGVMNLGGITNTPIGATPSTGAFTTLSASGIVSGTGFTNLLSPYALSSALSAYLTTATAASTYYLQTNPAGYQTAANVTTALTTLTTGAAENYGRNILLNGRINVQQRGTGPWTVTGYYTADRWQMSVVGDTFSASVISLPPATIVGDESAAASLQVVVTGGASAGNYTQIVQNTLDAKRTSNKTVTFSFWAKGSAALNVGVYLAQLFGTGGSPSTGVVIAPHTFAVTTTWTRYSCSFTVPSTSGETFGTNNDSSLVVGIGLSSGSTFASQLGVGVQSGTFDFWGLQLEIGSTVTALESRSTDDELLRCQYFYALGQIYVSGYGAAGAGIIASSTYPRTMRAIPTVAVTSSVYNNCNTFTFQVNNWLIAAFGLVTAIGTYSLNITYNASADL